ncbi:MAG TPA: Rieske 2Fe-2S domain-containing protein [Thermomicrobiales bacterium]|nr:Rieske 2Fe-2S domain-containing protein [Thermomicrobiales bacterium]
MTPLVRTLAGIAGGWLATKVFGLLETLQAAHGATPARKLTSRRSFTRNATLGAIGIVTAQIAGGFVWLLWPNKTGAFGGEITVSAEAVPEVGGDPFRYSQGQFYVVNTDNGVLALWWKCPHLGCTVPFIAAENQFICPCHGSVYDYNGEYVAGPAPRGMDIMPLEVQEDGAIAVNTDPSTIILGDVDRSEVAVPYPA